MENKGILTMKELYKLKTINQAYYAMFYTSTIIHGYGTDHTCYHQVGRFSTNGELRDQYT